MTAKEMHIEVSQATQKIAANKTRKLLPQEVDWLLNKNQQRFIQSKVSPDKKIESKSQYQIDTDAIRTLLVPAIIPAAYIRSGGQTQYQAILPGNYSYLISDESNVQQTCGKSKTPSNKSLNLLVLPFPKSIKESAPYYQNVSISIGNSNISLSGINTRQQGSYTGFPSKSDNTFLRDILTTELERKGFNVYWEIFNNLRYSNSFIVVTDLEEISITIDGTETKSTPVKYNYQHMEALGKWKPNRLTDSGEISTLMATPYLKSTPQSLISELRDRSLFVYGDDTSFIVSGVRITYVRKPAQIDVILGQSSELPEEFHHTICDLTVEYIKGLLSDPSWEVKLRDNMLRSHATV